MTTRTTATAPDAAALRRPALVRTTWLLAGAGVIVVLCVVSLALGNRDVAPSDVLGTLLGNGPGGVDEGAVVSRWPRTVLGLLIGGALGMAGATMQAVTRNPLADPGILGVSAGAALAVVIGIAFFGMSDPYLFILVAILGAAASAVFVYAIGSIGRGGATPLKLALAGAATSAAFVSLVSAVLLPRAETLTLFRFWQIGGVGGASWDRIAVIAPVLALGALICLISARGMNALALGDELAAGLGEHVLRTRLVASLGAVVLCGAATAIAGPIGFVGLVIPHLCRLLVGTDLRWLLPASALTGAGLLVAADVVGRVVARPEEIQVGIITAFIGAPVFIWIVRRQKVREL